MILAFALAAPAALAAPDVTPLQQVLDQHLKGGRLDYAAIAASDPLDGYLAQLAAAPEPSDRAAKMAFWINAYNALTIDLVADHWPLASIRDLDGGDPWGKRRFSVAGKQVTLNDIEHQILRPMGDPRIHAAVNCASIGCPPLYPRAFTAAGLEAQLSGASSAWAAGNGARIDQAGGAVGLSKIFDWYGDDFLARTDTDVPGLDGKQQAAIDFLADHLAGADAAWLRAGGYSVSWVDYDWRVNAR